jgi:hypothetical protein
MSNPSGHDHLFCNQFFPVFQGDPECTGLTANGCDGPRIEVRHKPLLEREPVADEGLQFYGYF